MEKTLTVTIKVEKDKPTKIDFFEPESGLTKEIKIHKDCVSDMAINAIGIEILSWVSLMEDEMEDDLNA